jgi:hypothetical protein
MFLDDLVHNAVALFALIPFSGATWAVVAILGFFVWLFVQGDKNPKSPIQWEDLIIDTSNNRASPYKLGYLLGLIVGTWVVVNLASKGTLGIDIFGPYLTYLLGGAGVNMYGKKGLPSIPLPDDTPTPPAVVPGDATPPTPP